MIDEHDLNVIEQRALSHGDQTVVPMLVAEVRRLRAGRAPMEDFVVNVARHRRGCQRTGCARPFCDTCVCSCGLDAAKRAALGDTP